MARPFFGAWVGMWRVRCSGPCLSGYVVYPLFGSLFEWVCGVSVVRCSYLSGYVACPLLGAPAWVVRLLDLFFMVAVRSVSYGVVIVSPQHGYYAKSNTRFT